MKAASTPTSTLCYYMCCTCLVFFSYSQFSLIPPHMFLAFICLIPSSIAYSLFPSFNNSYSVFSLALSLTFCILCLPLSSCLGCSLPSFNPSHSRLFLHPSSPQNGLVTWLISHLRLVKNASGLKSGISRQKRGEGSCSWHPTSMTPLSRIMEG